MENVAAVEKSAWDTRNPWQVRVKKSEAYNTKGVVLGAWKTRKKAEAFAAAFNEMANKRVQA